MIPLGARAALELLKHFLRRDVLEWLLEQVVEAARKAAADTATPVDDQFVKALEQIGEWLIDAVAEKA